MEQFISNSNAMLIQGMTERSLESMISRLLDEKLATIIESTPKVEKRPDNGLYRRKEAAAILRVSLVTLDHWTKLGIINARRVGTRVYYTDKDINDAMKKYLNKKGADYERKEKGSLNDRQSPQQQEQR